MNTHRGGSRLATTIAALCLGLALPAALASPASARDDVFNSSFPHLFYNDTGWMEGSAYFISQFDVMTAAFWNQDGPTRAKLDSLVTLHDGMKRLAYFNPAGYSLPYVGTDPTHVVNRLTAGIQTSWFARNEFGQMVYFDPTLPEMEMFNLSSKCPRVGGKTWGEYIADFAATQILGSGRWEGFMIDNLWDSASWINPIIPGSIDFNMDGVADHPDSADAWWRLGVTQFLTRLRNQTGYDEIMIGNGNGRQYPFLNGRYFEDYPFREGWTQSMQEVADWQNAGRDPSLLALVTRGAPNNYRLMRYGLCSALLSGEMSHHFDQSNAPNMVFYDEYRIELGKPDADPVELGITEVTSADFEGGMPPHFSATCGTGQGVLTTNPAQVIDGNVSFIGRPGSAEVWQLFLCSDPSDVHLVAGRTYTLSFKYRVLAEPPGDGYFYAGARSDANQTASNNNILTLDLPAGTVGEARGDVTLENYSNYYLYWGLKNGGQIVIDSIQLIEGQGGAFRRDFENGIALVNPTGAPFTVSLGGVFHRIDGVVDPVTNNGQSTTQVTLAAEDGLVLLRHPHTAVEEEGAPAITPLVTAYPNPARISMTPAVEIAGVPSGGSVTIVSPLGRIVRMLTPGDPSMAGTWRWDLRTASAQNAASGVYLAMVRDGNRKVVGTVRLAIRR